MPTIAAVGSPRDAPDDATEFGVDGAASGG
jgi:hypothetical protein